MLRTSTVVKVPVTDMPAGGRLQQFHVFLPEASRLSCLNMSSRRIWSVSKPSDLGLLHSSFLRWGRSNVHRCSLSCRERDDVPVSREFLREILLCVSLILSFPPLLWLLLSTEKQKKKKIEFQYVYLRPRRSVTALAVCSSAPPGSGTVGPTGKLSHSEGQCWPGLRK